jgi:hypothetical protein
MAGTQIADQERWVRLRIYHYLKQKKGLKNSLFFYLLWRQTSVIEGAII